MAIQDQISLIAQLSALGESIPGLDITPIIENIANKNKEIKQYILMCEEEAKENQERGMTKEQAQKEADKKKKEVIDTYKKNIESFVQEQIDIIKSQYKIIKDGVKAIPDDVKATIANILLPPAISAPPSAPNPIYALNLAAETKNSLTSLLNTIVSAMLILLKAATAIQFEVPAVVLTIGETIKTLDSLLASIPV